MNPRVCRRCKLTKRPEEFYFRVSGTRDSICCECKRTENRARYHRVKEIRARQRAKIST